MLILSVVGARPQFVKAAVVSRALRRRHREVLVHTGQHYDDRMSGLFFRELDIPAPDHHLGIGSGTHGEQTGRMLPALERVIADTRPDAVLVYGDTNSTLAGALASAKLNVPVAHVEAGCRSYVRSMPEEINRVLTDHLSALLLCPTARAVENLVREGLHERAHHVGDVMLDLQLAILPEAEASSTVLGDLGLTPDQYLVATIHRAANTDDPRRLRTLLESFRTLDHPVVLPVHPRTRHAIDALPRGTAAGVRLVEPVGYRDMLVLLRHARLALTDSGGIQKEAFFLGTPCLTLRDETEWMETVEAGWNLVVGDDGAAIRGAVRSWKPQGTPPTALFGDGHAAEHIVEALDAWQDGVRSEAAC